MNANTDIRAAVPGEAVRAAARSRLYALFAQLFRYPEKPVFAALADGSLAAELRDTLAACLPAAAEDFDSRWATALRAGGDFDGYAAAYLAAFENDAPRPSISLYEGSYGQRRNDKPGLLLELKSFYRNFGLAMGDNDLEDALPAELEFMQFLAAKQAQALVEGTDPRPYVHAQKDFLERHLGAWMPAVAGEAQDKLEKGCFTAAAELLAACVALDATGIAAEFAGPGGNA
ncbi:MAG: molecular chaperone TorD family protein [Rhodocyclaceae bacterium]|nr:molecular chaperone TorD family protein [Rhodocyclaceae bacterium]